MATTAGTLSAAEIAAVVARHFPASQRVTAVAVALAESGGKAGVISKPNNDRWSSRDHGLFQINDYWHRAFIAQGTWSDPSANAGYAAQLAGPDGAGWRLWTTFRTGEYREHLPAAQAAVSGVLGAANGPNVGGPGFTPPGEPWESGKVLNGDQLYWLLTRTAGESPAAATRGTAIGMWLDQAVHGGTSSYGPWGLTADEMTRGAAAAGVSGDVYEAAKIPNNAARIAHAVHGADWTKSPWWAQAKAKEADAAKSAGKIDNPTANGQPAGFDPFDQRTWDEGAAVEVGIPNPLDGLAAIGRFFALLTSGEFWRRAGLVIAGGILVITAGALLLKAELK